MADRLDGILGRLADGAPLGEVEAGALASATDILTLGMLADEARRKRHGAATTFVRVADVDLPASGSAVVIPPAAREVRVRAAAADLASRLSALHDIVKAAGVVPVSACSLADLEAYARAGGRPLVGVLRGIRGTGVASIAEAPIDRLEDAESSLEAVREAGLGLARLTVERPAEPDARLGLIRRAIDLQHALGWLMSFAPLPRDNIPSIQVDWALYGPKLAQVALTVGADDLDAVSAVDDDSEGRRRAPLEDVRRNIEAAALVPVERDGVYRRTA